MKTFKTLALASAFALPLFGGQAHADCAFENQMPVKSLSAGFEAWKAVTDAMAECGNVEAELDQEFRLKQAAAFSTDPSLYHIGGVANATLVTLLNDGLIRPLDDLVAEYGQNLRPNQLIKIDGQIMAIAMMVNLQHLMYRSDILADLGIEVPTTYEEVLEAAAKIQDAGVVDYPLGGTFATGWNLGTDFINMYIGHGGEFFDADGMPTLNNEAGVASLEMMKRLSAFMDPEYLASDSTTVQQQFQQGRIAIANLWASRAGAMDNEGESQVVGLVEMASAPTVGGGAIPATAIWWDGIVIAQNISDEEAANAFRVAMEGMDADMVRENNDLAVWLIDGFEPGRLAAGAAASAAAGAKPFPASAEFGLLHTSLGNGVADFLTGAKDAETTLADIEAAYLTAAQEAGLVE